LPPLPPKNKKKPPKTGEFFGGGGIGFCSKNFSPFRVSQGIQAQIWGKKIGALPGLGGCSQYSPVKFFLKNLGGIGGKNPKINLPHWGKNGLP
jgi:hypothetical protein